jgi:putative DNA primase/helicase
MRGAVSGEEADGLIPRFQVLLYADPPTKFVNIDRYPDARAKGTAYAVFQALDRLDPVAKGCEVDEAHGVPYLRFSTEAQDLFDQWRVKLETRVRDQTLSSALNSHLSKYRSLIPSLALIFHLIDSYDCSRLEPVSRHAAELAAAWCELLEAHAHRVYQSATDGDNDDAVRLGDKLRGSLPNPFTCWQVAQKGWAGLHATQDVRRAIGILEDNGWVKTVQVPPTSRGGRPSEQVWTHPALLKAQKADR